LNTMFFKGGFDWPVMRSTGRFITAKSPYKKNPLKLIECSNFYPGRKLINVVTDVNGEYRSDYLNFLKQYDAPAYIDKHILGVDGNRKELTKACISHSWAAVFALQDIERQINALGGSLEITPALTAQKLHRRRFLPKDAQIFDHTKTAERIALEKLLSFDSYYGGRVENFIRSEEGTIVENVAHIDINSSYPYSMRNFDYPNVWNHRIVEQSDEFSKKEEIKRFKAKLYSAEGWAKLRMSTPNDQNIMLLPVNLMNGQLIFPEGRIVGVWSFPEIRRALEVGYKIKKVLMYGYMPKTKAPLFKDYVDVIYPLKKEKHLKNGVKLMLNSLYGKFGQKANIEQGWVLASEEEAEIYINQTKSPEYGYSYNPGDFRLYKDLILKYEAEPPLHERGFAKTAYPLIAAYVTSYSRINLYNAMIAIGADDVLYCDTDSIFADRNAVLNAIDAGKIKIDSFELGCWDIEHENCSFECKGLKHYRLKNEGSSEWEYTIKGVPKPYMAEFWEKERVSFKRPIKFANAVRNGKKINYFVTVEKSNLKPFPK
ncbi:MAG TPA: hypothetical protein EYP28_04580, partial [Methanophagales archaeon]|nr:hypothetical protein [Methanophagales archaeon]